VILLRSPQPLARVHACSILLANCIFLVLSLRWWLRTTAAGLTRANCNNRVAVPLVAPILFPSRMTSLAPQPCRKVHPTGRVLTSSQRSVGSSQTPSFVDTACLARYCATSTVRAVGSYTSIGSGNDTVQMVRSAGSLEAQAGNTDSPRAQ
jgi:hypothetical protein